MALAANFMFEQLPFMAKILSLNDDVLLKVFHAAVQASSPKLSDNQAPLNVSRTCRHWRNLLLANPRFWLCLDCKSDDELKLVPLWLRRSQDAVIEVSISGFSLLPPKVDPVLLEGALRVIFNNQSRLGKLLFAGLAHIPPVRVDNFSNLVEFRAVTSPPPVVGDAYLPLKTDNTHAVSVSSSHLQHRAIAPKLRNLDFWFGFALATRETLEGTWALLHQCPNLEQLSLHVLLCEAVEHNPIDPILSLEKLESIDLGCDGEDDNGLDYVRFLLRHLRAPSLHSLTITTIMNDTLVEAAREFLLGSNYGAPVREAGILMDDCSVQLQKKFLQDLSQVTKLTIPDDFDFGDAYRLEHTYQLLTLGSESGDFCPLLESFETSYSPSDVEIMAKFLLSRLRQTRTFRASIRSVKNEDLFRICEHPELQEWLEVNGSDIHCTNGDLFGSDLQSL